MILILSGLQNEPPKERETHQKKIVLLGISSCSLTQHLRFFVAQRYLQSSTISASRMSLLGPIPFSLKLNLLIGLPEFLFFSVGQI
jgi:hypothetical protein